MDQTEVLEILDSSWFFSNALFTKKPEKPSSDLTESEPVKCTISPQEKRSVEVPVSEPVVSEATKSLSPRRKEEEKRRRMRRQQREFCRGLNLEAEVEFCRSKELKDERAMKRQLKTWAMAVASSSIAQTRPIMAICC